MKRYDDCKLEYGIVKVKIPLSMKIRNLFSPCRKCKRGIDYHCIYCPKRPDKNIK